MAAIGDKWLIQQIGENVILFHRHTEEEIVRYPIEDKDATACAQATIAMSGRLTDEEKSFAHFWCGYFYAHGRLGVF